MNKKTALEQLDYWIEQYYRLNGTPTLDGIKGQINLLKDYEREQLHIANVSVSLLRKKAKEYAKFIYAEEYNDPMYHPEVMQTMSDFEAGFKAGMRFYNER